MQTKNMSSRRLMNRSLSGDGRYSYNGNDIASLNSRGGCRSYPNSVQPERRSTLCSVMAQLTEETQPTFESTLKSKAVSEAANVKFICTVSGHPVPEVTWYKDDVQLDRYCGLPKYEILRDGKTHKLHIYNCTLEDAAIYQASAQNSRGIVSCSGVLEVGTMNEYKIHQNYFAKLKQKNENRRREQEEPRETYKEKISEDLRTSSPERTQRKRRSPMETTPSFGASSPSEENEELNALSQTTTIEERLSSPPEVSESTPYHIPSDSDMSTNGDKGNQELTYIHDTVHMASNKQAGNYAKKKIKKREEITVMVNEDQTSGEKMEIQNTGIQKQLDLKDETKLSENPSVKVKKGTTDLKSTQIAQKPIITPRCPPLKKTIASQGQVVEDTKQFKTSDNQKNLNRISSPLKPHSQLQSQNAKHVKNQRVEKSNPSFPDSKLMDLDDNKTNPAAGPWVNILPHSCGKGDVNSNTGDRNASVNSPRASAGGEPTEPEICRNISSSAREVAMELNHPPPLMPEVTDCVLNTHSTLGSHHLVSHEKKERAGESNHSTGHVSHMLQDGQVTTAMNSSLEQDLLIKMSELDHKDGNEMIKKGSCKPKVKIKSVATSLNGTGVNDNEINADNKAECIHANVQGHENISEEKNTLNSKHSVSLLTEFVQIRGDLSRSNQDVVETEIMNNSSNSKRLMKHTKKLEFQKDSTVATDNDFKMDIQQQDQSTAKNDNQQPLKTSIIADGDDDSDFNSPTFLSQHPKTLLPNFTIPAIYITDMDSTSPDNKTESMESSNSVGKPKNTQFCSTTKALNNNNTVSQNANTINNTDNKDKTPGTIGSDGFSDAQVDLSMHPRPSEVILPQAPKSQENFKKSSENPCFTDTIASDFTGPSLSQLCNADESRSANESELSETKCPYSNLKTKSDSFIKQLRSAALNLETTTQRSNSITLHATPQRDIEGIDKYRQTNSEVKHEESVLLQRNNNLNAAVSPLPHSSEALKTTDVQIFNTTNQTLPSMPQPATLLNSVNDSASLDKNSPRLIRRGLTADLTKPQGNENVKTKSTDKENQFKVPQVIRKIRPEVFDTTGHLKLWCQFFNIVSDSTIKWLKDDVEVAEIKRSAGDETQLCLAIIQMSKRDCGLYRCTITNEYGQDSTEYLLSTEISSMFLQEEQKEVGEEVEMTPLIFSKGLADAGCWGTTFYGRVTTEEAKVGSGCEHKTRRLRVIYGLDPVFESGTSCFMKVRSPIAYESREDTVLAEKNLQITKQNCRIQNMAREYVKIFATETREIESFGSTLEIIPLYFMYRPASSVPYATVEAELKGVYMRFCGLDHNGSLVYNNKSEVAQKCSSFQHWIHQWTNGNVLLSRLEGVDTILTNIEVVTKTKGYQGFPCEANPMVFEQFPTQHQCNYFCGLLNLKPPLVPEMLQTSRLRGSSSPQTQRKATKSPKASRKSNPQTST